MTEEPKQLVQAIEKTPLTLLTHEDNTVSLIIGSHRVAKYNNMAEAMDDLEQTGLTRPVLINAMIAIAGQLAKYEINKPTKTN